MTHDIAFLLGVGNQDLSRPVKVAGVVYANLAEAREKAGISEGFGGLAGHWVWEVLFTPNRLSSCGAERLAPATVKVTYADGEEEPIEFDRTICKDCLEKIQRWYDSLGVEPVMLARQDAEKLLLVRFRGPQKCGEPEGYHVAQSVYQDAISDGYLNCIASQRTLRCDSVSVQRFVRSCTWYVFDREDHENRFETDAGELDLRREVACWRPGERKFDNRYRQVSADIVLQSLGEKSVFYNK